MPSITIREANFLSSIKEDNSFTLRLHSFCRNSTMFYICCALDICHEVLERCKENAASWHQSRSRKVQYDVSMDILGRIRTELDSWFAFNWWNFRPRIALVLLILFCTEYDVLRHFFKLWLPDWRLPTAIKAKTSKTSNFKKASCTFVDRILSFWSCFTS